MSSSSEDEESADELEDIASAFHLIRLMKKRKRGWRHRGSVVGRERTPRPIQEGAERLQKDFFDNPPIYGPRFFRRRFRMRKELFLRIEKALLQYKPKYFKQGRDCTGLLGCSTRQKLAAAIFMLCSGKSADSFDRELRMGESTILQALHEFTQAIVHVFGKKYMRSPNEEDLQRLLQTAEARGFPGMLGSLDCMHWVWENCPSGWKGQYRGHQQEPTVILEAVAGPDRWIWHFNFGCPGGLNDINVLHRSPLFDDLVSGRAPQVNFTVNGNSYNMGYYLADGIYPQWATLVKGIPLPQSLKQRLFDQKQSEYRKDVECAFGILQKKFAIVKGPSRNWYPVDMWYIMQTCVILHNMTVEDERDLDHVLGDEYDDGTAAQPLPREHPTIDRIIQQRSRIQNKQVDRQLQHDLIQHIWAKFGRDE